MTSDTYPLWGWGPADGAPDPAVLDTARRGLSARLGFPLAEPHPPAALGDLPADRVSARLPAGLAGLAGSAGLAGLAGSAGSAGSVGAAALDRARHGVGRSYRDLILGLRGRPEHVPDVVLRPRTGADVAAALDWCANARVAVIPFGGGTSVVGGVEPAVGAGFTGCVSLDLRGLAGVPEVDPVSRAARVLAGTTGPELERALAAHGLTARFYPQSFERSTVGGWLATRAAGHFSTRLTHIDDQVESVRALTPSGAWDSLRLPGSGAGPSPDRWLLGSEGCLGVITEAWLRVQPRPVSRWKAVYAAPDWATGARAVRAVLQDGLSPATCRLVDPVEAGLTGLLSTGEAALVLGLESTAAAGAGDPLAAEAGTLLRLLEQHRLRPVEAGAAGPAGDRWRSSFVRAPYLREQLVALGALVETFETATTWDRLDDLVSEVRQETERVVADVCGTGRVSCRLTHLYPDGAAPYFTVLAPARRGAELEQWNAIKLAASEVVLRAGGTITHHHAVGRDHLPWYERQRPGAFALALAAAKTAVDPTGVCNPGVLLRAG